MGKEIKVKIEVDSSEIDAAIDKAERLKKLLEALSVKNDLNDMPTE